VVFVLFVSFWFLAVMPTRQQIRGMVLLLAAALLWTLWRLWTLR
jgi:hypothetical protein